MKRIKTLIMGAAGRDFHNFNCVFREDPRYEVVCFTATQIPDIDGRAYPAELAGEHYPQGIPIHPESSLQQLIVEHGIEEVVFSYSDVPHEFVMHRAALVNAVGADFRLLGGRLTELSSSVPVISVCASRTGCGKSQTTRRVVQLLREANRKVVCVRHPMPYGDLASQKCQRFATLEDLKRHNCTIEEMEEYEPHIAMGNVIYAGVDYEAILREAEKEADVILWDGGNNDTPFFKADLRIVVVDPHRAGHELIYYPGETNVCQADVIVINKIDTAQPEDVEEVRSNCRLLNPDALVVDAASPIRVDDPEVIRGRECLVVEDGPTLTHGEMSFGAGMVAAERFGAVDVVDPRPWAVGGIEEALENYPDVESLLPAMGYGEGQIKDLEQTINATECEAVIIGTPIDLRRVLEIEKPATRVYYELQEIGSPTLVDALKNYL